MIQLLPKTAIITGASSGIGKALAFHAASKEYNLVLTSRNLSDLERVKQQISDHYSVQILLLSGDISQELFCKELISRALNAFGNIHVLINNAGISMRGIFLETDLHVLKRIMDVNFWGSIYCTKYALPHLLKTQGSVIGISSIAGFKGLPGRTGYSASKFALQGFLESLRIENRKTGLHVLIACPGYTASNIRKSALNSQGLPQGETPLPEHQLMPAEEVAMKVWRAYENKKHYLILTIQGKLAVFLNKISHKLADYLTFKVVSQEKKSPFS